MKTVALLSHTVEKKNSAVNTNYTILHYAQQHDTDTTETQTREHTDTRIHIHIPDIHGYHRQTHLDAVLKVPRQVVACVEVNAMKVSLSRCVRCVCERTAKQAS